MFIFFLNNIVMYMSEIAFDNRMETWEECLRGLPQRLKEVDGRPPLRHGKPYLSVWEISEQFYCEMKVEMENKYGEVKTEAKNEGKDIHGELLKMEEAEIEDIIEGIRSVQFYQTSLPLLAEVEGVPVIGRPDCVVFDRGYPAFIYELKTFNAKTFRLHDDRKVQAMIYALLLEEMGFDCSRISLHVVGMRREIE